MNWTYTGLLVARVMQEMEFKHHDILHTFTKPMGWKETKQDGSTRGPWLPGCIYKLGQKKGNEEDFEKAKDMYFQYDDLKQYVFREYSATWGPKFQRNPNGAVKAALDDHEFARVCREMGTYLDNIHRICGITPKDYYFREHKKKKGAALAKAIMKVVEQHNKKTESQGKQEEKEEAISKKDAALIRAIVDALTRPVDATKHSVDATKHSIDVTNGHTKHVFSHQGGKGQRFRRNARGLTEVPQDVNSDTEMEG